MSALGSHLRDRVRYQRDRIRSGLRLRHERPWGGTPPPVEPDAFDDLLGGVTVRPDERARLHAGIRFGIARLRKLRALHAEFLELQKRARGGR